MRFALIDRAKEEFPVHRLCRVLGASQSGYFAWKGRPACRRQHEDMVLLAHIRSAFCHEAEQAIGRYIDGFYNPVRRHSALDFISPLQFKRRAAQTENALHFPGASPSCC